VNFATRFVVLLANGFVVYYYWVSYQHGMPAGRTLIYLFFSLIAINLALFFGRKLGERSRRK
jgi:hypothetical protein